MAGVEYVDDWIRGWARGSMSSNRDCIFSALYGGRPMANVSHDGKLQ